jgi:hypothetical protein
LKKDYIWSTESKKVHGKDGIKVANICKGEGKGWHRIQAHAKEG